MTEHVYTTQQSTESGWDNPFRPDGDLSREADEIVSLIKGGKPITPTFAAPELAAEETKISENNLSMSSPHTQNAKPGSQSTPKILNGTKNGETMTDGRAGQVEVQHAPPQELQQAEHVTIKKKPKCECCVIQ